MKKARTAVILAAALCVLQGVAEGARERLTYEEGDIDFNLDWLDDGRSNPYRLKFTDTNNAQSTFRFNAAGQVTKIDADSEKYKVLYKSDGDLKRVKLTSSGRRKLEGKDFAQQGDVFERHRRLYACSECERNWDTVCDEGVPTVCNLVGYGAPILAAGEAAISTMCETFGNACSRAGGVEACAGQCEGDGNGGNDVNPCLDSTSDLYKCNLPGDSDSPRSIDLSGCGLVDADAAYLPACFENFGKTNIAALFLSENELTTLDEDVFAGLTEVFEIFLVNVPISHLPAGLFSDTTILTYLVIQGNQLATIEPGLFAGLVQLNELYIDNNLLTSLPAGLFDDNTALDYLSFVNNDLTTLPEDLFVAPATLFELDLLGNPDLQCVPTTTAEDVLVDSPEILQGTCECLPTNAVMCDEGLSCEAGLAGYTCG